MTTPRGLARLLRDASDHRWALRCVLAYLERVDVVRLLVTALEHGDARFRELTHWLQDGDVPGAPLYSYDDLGRAVELDCWRAAEALSHRVYRQASVDVVRESMVPQWGASDWDAQHVAVPRADGALRRVMLGATQSKYVFREEVLAAVAARGDLEAVQSMLVHIGVVRHDPEVPPFMWVPTCNSSKQDAFRAAFDARQFHVTDWIIAHPCCCHGCDQEECAVPNWFLVELFASCGDLVNLKKVQANKGLDGRDIDTAIELAAGNGHVAVLEWIATTCRQPMDPKLLESAAERGQLTVLEWLWARQDMCNTRANFLQAAARCGQLDVVRWLKQNLDEDTWGRYEAHGVVAAGHACQLQTLRFFHEECGRDVGASYVWDLTVSTSVEYVEYVLDRVVVDEYGSTQLVDRAAEESNLDVVKYLTLQCGYWSRRAFAIAVERGCWWNLAALSDESCSFEISRFLYTHARVRAAELNTSLDAQIDFDGVKIFCSAVSTARWLSESVPEVDTGETLASSWLGSERNLSHGSLEQAFISACLRARPTQCRLVQWLPMWTIEATCFEAFSMLVDMAHPDAVSTSMYFTIAKRVRDSRFMLKLLAVQGLKTRALPCILHWASAIGAEQVLSAIDNQWGDVIRSVDCSRLAKATFQAVQHGHVTVLQWFHERALLLPRSNEQDKVNPQESNAVQLIHEAVKHDRAECLHWLVDALNPPTDVIVQALLAGVTQRSHDVVRWITHRYTPVDLGISTEDVALVRTCLASREVTSI